MKKKKFNCNLFSLSFFCGLSKICERIIVLKDGNIVEENDTIQILKEPKNDYTKLLIKAATAD